MDEQEMSPQEIKGIHPPIVIYDEAQDFLKEVPLTLEDGTKIGTAKVQQSVRGLEIEATVNDEHAHIVRADSSPQFSLAGDGTAVQYVSGGSIFDQEVAGLEKLMNVHSALRGMPTRKPKEDNSKPKRRAASKRARKARKNRG